MPTPISTDRYHLAAERRRRVLEVGTRFAHELGALDRALVEMELAEAAALIDEEDFYLALGLDPRFTFSRLAWHRWKELCQARAAFTPSMLERLVCYAQHKQATMLKQADEKHPGEEHEAPAPDHQNR